ncbi:hypothetical protein Q7P37_006260 [Cladosporium fusiforme]
MSTTTLTMSTATNSSSSSTGSTVQSSLPTLSSPETNTPASVTTPATTATAHHQKSNTSSTTPSAASTPPTSRPSTPTTPTGTSSNPSSPQESPVDKQIPKSRRLNRLSHISIATWIGVGLTLAGLIVAVYYGLPMMRLAIWTAQNDFREACKSEAEAGMTRTSACNATLHQPPQPPPLNKRMTVAMHEHSDLGLRLWAVATCFVLLLCVCKALRDLAQRSRQDSEQSKANGGVSAPATTGKSLHGVPEGDVVIPELFDSTKSTQRDEVILTSKDMAEPKTLASQSEFGGNIENFSNWCHSLREMARRTILSLEPFQGLSLDHGLLLELTIWLLTATETDIQNMFSELSIQSRYTPRQNTEAIMIAITVAIRKSKNSSKSSSLAPNLYGTTERQEQDVPMPAQGPMLETTAKTTLRRVSRFSDVLHEAGHLPNKSAASSMLSTLKKCYGKCTSLKSFELAKVLKKDPRGTRATLLRWIVIVGAYVVLVFEVFSCFHHLPENVSLASRDLFITRMLLLVFLTLLFGSAVLCSTHSTRHELFAASAAYCAVLAIFVHYFAV